LLNENGATLVEKNGIYAVVPTAVGAASNRASAANAIGAGTQVVALRYAAAKDLAKTLEPFIAEGGKISADPGRNALLVRGDAAVRGTLVSLIRAFDIDLLAGQSYALFPAGDSDPAKLASELERVLQAQGEGALAGIVRVLPMARVNAVLVVSSQPRYIDAAKRFVSLMHRAEDATARTWHVYYVQNGQSADLELLLQRAFTPRNVSPTGGPPGTTAPGAEQLTIGGGRGPGGGTTGFGGQGPPQVSAEPAGEPVRQPAREAAERQAAWARLSVRPCARGHRLPPTTIERDRRRGKTVFDTANRRNNALLIARASTRSRRGCCVVDIIPLQVLIEATIAEVTFVRCNTVPNFSSRSSTSQRAGPIQRSPHFSYPKPYHLIDSLLHPGQVAKLALAAHQCIRSKYYRRHRSWFSTTSRHPQVASSLVLTDRRARLPGPRSSTASTITDGRISR
jgi:general secretion pathway protein D